MAWNQPTSTEHSAKRSKPRKPSKGVWLVATAVVVVAAAVVAIALLPRGKVTPSAVVEKPVQTKVASTPSMLVPEPQQPVEVKVDPNARPTKVGEVVNGYVMLPSGRIHKPTGVVTNRVADYGKSKYSIFENRSDNEIAGILMANPGEAVVGTKRYDKWFEKQFLKSIETPIKVSPDDEPWQADLKKLVMQARLELKEAHDKGEDIAAIMSESRQQLQDLAKYKQSVKQIYAQNVKECATEQEVADLQKAVNVMLEEKGCAPMNFTPLTKMRLMKGKTDE
jgi:hypothetical protein